MGAVFSKCAQGTPVVDALKETKVNPTDGLAITTAQQPLLDPQDWLLTESEITAARNGAARYDLAVQSAGNTVTTFASSDQYFEHLLDALEVTKGPDDFIWIAGWTLNHEVPLAPQRENFGETSLRRVVERAVLQRGVHVRALVWANKLERAQVLATRDWMNGLAGAGSALMILDGRLPHPTSSHHQKFVVVRRGDSLLAFVGGLDIALDRWDTIHHDQKTLRETRGIKGDSDGWIDAALRLHGPAALDVAATFVARWNSSVKPAKHWHSELLDFDNPDAFPAIKLPTQGITMPTTGSAVVQIVRTFSPREPDLYPELAPQGELTILQGRLKAIGKARNFIFIEDQYFFFMPQLMTALREALQRVLRVIVVVQKPTVSSQSRIAGYEKLVYEMARPLLTEFPTKFHIFTTKETRNLYIHTKLVLVDDVLLSVSSANWNRRSMTSDSEIGASIVDTKRFKNLADGGIEVGGLVRDFRLRKFAELTGQTASDLAMMSIVESCDWFSTAAADPSSLLERLEVEPRWKFIVFQEEYTLKVVDPDDLNDTDD
ncbi:hypothetical protein ATCC90586_005098 [Pythium insidiosum]|nr:hypothetical protein ATCC90586_005098 [Pythium insidiosum]